MPLFFDSPDGRYRIHYSLTGTDAVPAFDGDSNGVPDWIEDVAVYADSSWRHEVLNMGYFEPPSDGNAGGSSHYDLYCALFQSLFSELFSLHFCLRQMVSNEWSRM